MTSPPPPVNPRVEALIEADNLRSDSPTPSIMSFRSSVHSDQLFRQLSGRMLNTQLEMYMLPVDDEEQDRQELEHRLLYLVLDALYAAPDLVAKAMTPKFGLTPAVLDIGCGSGSWAIDMAREFPHADVVGIDLTPPTLVGDNIPNNCRFEVDDANLDLSHYTESFNVVHMRNIGQGIQNYQDTIHRVAQTLRVDGVILLVTAHYQFFDEQRQPLSAVNEGEPGWSAAQTLFSMVYDMARRLGGDLEAPTNWEAWLQKCPFYTNVGTEDIFVPIGPWMTHLDLRCTRIAHLLQTDASRLFPSFRPLLIQGGLDPTKTDRWISIAEREIREMKPRMFAKFRYAWAARTKTKWYDIGL